MASQRAIVSMVLLLMIVAFVAGPVRAVDRTGGLVWSTFVGGDWEYDWVEALTIDAAGNVYLAGYTNSPNFPVTSGAYDQTFGGDDDAFVAKLSADGSTILFSTLLGGSGMDVAHGIALDAGGNIVVAGETWSTDFPTTPGSFDETLNGYGDLFVTKLNASGDRLLFSTFLGGSVQEWASSGIALDGSGNVYLAGSTDSVDFPTTTGAVNRTLRGHQDAVVTEVGADGSRLLFGTYLGGSAGDGALGITVDVAGRAIVVGSTYSTDFPATSGAFDNTSNGDEDVFVAGVDFGGAGLTFATLLGGSLRDLGTAVAVDLDGNVYVAGGTYSPDFPPTDGAYDQTYNGLGDAFLVSFNPSGDVMRYGTFLGGIDLDQAGGLAVDAQGNAFMVGATTSADFPATSHAYDSTRNGTSDFFLAKIGSTGAELRYATYLGGSGDFDTASSVVLDTPGNAFAAGWTSSRDFPTTPRAYDREIGDLVGLGDAFVLKFGFSGPTTEGPSLLVVGAGVAAVSVPALGAFGALLARRRKLKGQTLVEKGGPPAQKR